MGDLVVHLAITSLRGEDECISLLGSVSAEDLLAFVKELRRANRSRMLELELDHFDDDERFRALDALTEALRSDESFEEIQLSGEGFQTEHLTAVLEAAGANPRVKRITLHSLHFVEPLGSTLAALVRATTHLEHLGIKYCSMGEKAACGITAVLAENRSLRSLEFGFERIGAVALQSILDVATFPKDAASGIASQPQSQAPFPSPFPAPSSACLESLSLNGCGISDAGAVAIARVLADPLCSLARLSLDEGDFLGEGSSALVEALAVNRSLKELSLNANFMDDTGAHLIARALQRNTTLEALSLNDDIFTDVGLAAIADALHDNTSLRSLSLRMGMQLFENCVGSAGAAALASALRANASLTSFHFEPVITITPGALALVRSIEQSASLKRLHLVFGPNDDAPPTAAHRDQFGGDPAGDGAASSDYEAIARALGEALQRTRVLEDLFVTVRTLPNTLFAEEIARGAAENASLRSLTLYVREASEPFLARLARMIRSNTTLVALDVQMDAEALFDLPEVALAIVFNETLETMSFEHLSTRVSTRSRQMLRDALAVNCALTNLGSRREELHCEARKVNAKLARERKGPRDRFLFRACAILQGHSNDHDLNQEKSDDDDDDVYSRGNIDAIVRVKLGIVLAGNGQLRLVAVNSGTLQVVLSIDLGANIRGVGIGIETKPESKGTLVRLSIDRLSSDLLIDFSCDEEIDCVARLGSACLSDEDTIDLAALAPRRAARFSRIVEAAADMVKMRALFCAALETMGLPDAAGELLAAILHAAIIQ